MIFYFLGKYFILFKLFTEDITKMLNFKDCLLEVSMVRLPSLNSNIDLDHVGLLIKFKDEIAILEATGDTVKNLF